jgi:hypothetical protein
MDFSDKWFRKRFRDSMGILAHRMSGESPVEHHTRIVNYLNEHGVTLSASGKMAYDRNMYANRLTNIHWPERDRFMDWARTGAPDVIKKRYAPKHNGRVTTPATKPAKPTTTGWDDFDWSR